jgi:hypothetical protein
VNVRKTAFSASEKPRKTHLWISQTPCKNAIPATKKKRLKNAFANYDDSEAVPPLLLPPLLS